MSPETKNKLINKGDTLICMIDEYNRGDKQAFDGFVTWKDERGVDVCYLSGYRSRNDFVPWSDIVAKLDLSQPRISVAGGTYSGHFIDMTTPEEAPTPTL